MDKRHIRIINNPERLAIPIAHQTSHQAVLKQRLFAATRPNNKKQSISWEVIMSKKKVVLSAASLIVTLVAFMAVALFAGPNQAAYAEQLTSKSLHDVVVLSPDQRQDLDMRINGNAESELNAAKHAKDLQVLTYAEFQKLTPQAPQSMGVHGPDNGNGPAHLDPASLKYLKYTDSNGATHVIGVNNSGMPTMIMIYRNSGHNQEGSMQVMGHDNGPSTMVSGSVEGASGNDGQSAPTNCSRSSGGNVTCTTNGDPSTKPNCQTYRNGIVTCSSAHQ